MTTFWLSFTDPEATADKRFLGVAIFDMDESAGELSTTSGHEGGGSVFSLGDGRVVGPVATGAAAVT